MEPAQGLAGQLAALTEALEEPGTDLQAILAVLVDDLTVAVPSFLGLTMNLEIDDQQVALSAIDAELTGTAGASLSLSLHVTSGRSSRGTVVFYAHRPRAFVDLAADARRTFSPDAQVVMDGHLDPAGTDLRQPPTGGRVEEVAVINQAIGVLVARGYPPEQAHSELSARAHRDGDSLPHAAQTVLDSTTTTPR